MLDPPHHLVFPISTKQYIYSTMPGYGILWLKAHGKMAVPKARGKNKSAVSCSQATDQAKWRLKELATGRSSKLLDDYMSSPCPIFRCEKGCCRSRSGADMEVLLEADNPCATAHCHCFCSIACSLQQLTVSY